MLETEFLNQTSIIAKNQKIPIFINQSNFVVLTITDQSFDSEIEYGKISDDAEIELILNKNDVKSENIVIPLLKLSKKNFDQHFSKNPFFRANKILFCERKCGNFLQIDAKFENKHIDSFFIQNCFEENKCDGFFNKYLLKSLMTKKRLVFNKLINSSPEILLFQHFQEKEQMFDISLFFRSKKVIFDENFISSSDLSKILSIQWNEFAIKNIQKPLFFDLKIDFKTSNKITFRLENSFLEQNNNNNNDNNNNNTLIIKSLDQNITNLFSHFLENIQNYESKPNNIEKSSKKVEFYSDFINEQTELLLQHLHLKSEQNIDRTTFGVLITGPKSSGKTYLSLKMSNFLNSSIIHIDMKKLLYNSEISNFIDFKKNLETNIISHLGKKSIIIIYDQIDELLDIDESDHSKNEKKLMTNYFYKFFKKIYRES